MNDLADIVGRLGGSLSHGCTRARVPGPGHSRRDRSLSLRLGDDGRLLYFSFSGDDEAAVKAHLGIQPGIFRSVEYAPRMFRMAEIRAEQNKRLGFCRALWTRSESAQGTIAHEYLRRRMIGVHTMPDALRFCADAPRGYEAEQRQPAMVALVSDACGKACGLHVTFLREDGGAKLGRVMFGTVGGGAVRLFPVRPTLAIAEGIETALAYSYMKGVCSWAVLSTSGMTQWTPPDGCERVTVAADHDKNGAGLRAAQGLASRLPAGVAEIDMPEEVGFDWNDSVRCALAAGDW